jgi:imidazolonepropionase-like amidohydrolase
VGVDTIEHGLSLHREPALLERMAAGGQVLVPTLSTFHDLAERFADQWVPRLVDQARRQLEEAYLTLVAAHATGVSLAMGFDSGPPGSEPWELVRMAEGGLAPLAALRAATAGGAAALGRSDLGRLLPGAAADLLLLDGDPLADLRVLLRPGRLHLVLRDGVPIAGRELDPTPFNGQALPPDDAELPPPSGQPACCMPVGGADAAPTTSVQ